MPRVSAPLAFRFAGIAWPLASERVTLTLESSPGPRSRITSEDGWTLVVVPDLPAPTQDEGPLGPVAEVLREGWPHQPPPALRSVHVHVSAVGRSRPGLAAALRVLTRVFFPLRASGPPSPTRTDVEFALFVGTPWRGDVDLDARRLGTKVPISDERLAWLSDHLLLFDDPTAAPPPTDHAVAGPDPRLLLEAEPSALLAALTGHGVPEKPVWRAERLDRDLRAAGLLARWPLEGPHHLALVDAGRRTELRAALAAHGLAPADCRLGGPGYA